MVNYKENEKFISKEGEREEIESVEAGSWALIDLG